MIGNNINHLIRIQQYLKGELSPEEMNRLEREALDDRFLQEALEGYTEMEHLNTHRLTLLQQRLQDRITEQPQERSRLLFITQRLGIATVACLLFILACVLFWMINDRKNHPLRQKEVLVELSSPEAQAEKQPAMVRKLGASSAMPIDGWESYSDYVARTAKSTLRGQSAVLSFEVSEQGTPRNIQEKKGSQEALAEARRLLEKGPHWEPHKSAEVEFVF